MAAGNYRRPPLLGVIETSRCLLLGHAASEENFRTGVSRTRAACGPRGRFVRPAMLYRNFQIINICVI